MRAVAVFPQARNLRLIQVDEPQIARRSEVKLRILEVGICGTDKEISSFQYGTPPEGSEYLILGHEALGEVVEIGPDVRELAVGDLVVPMVRRPCLHAECQACRAGRPDFCVTGDFKERGIKELHGFLAEFVVDEAQYMRLVPRELRRVGVLTEPLSIAEKAFTQAVHIEQRMPWLVGVTSQSPLRSELTAAILGAGAVGLVGAMALRAMGIDTYVYDRVPPPNAKSQLVERIGAHYISPTDPTTSFTNLVSHVHFIYEATGVSQLAFEAISALSPNSILVFTGVPGQGVQKELDTDTLMRNMVLKNQVILGTVNADTTAYVAAIRHLGIFVERWPRVLETVISGRYPLEAYPDVLGQSGGIKNVLTFAPAPLE
jgi:threonine dehydrogenase-like Zn-dependent dehydrogenase